MDNSVQSPERDDVRSLAQDIIKLLNEECGMRPVCDRQDGSPHVVVTQGGAVRALRVRSSEFANLISFVAWQYLEKKTVPVLVRNAVIDTIEAMARFQGEKVDLHLRSAWHNGALYYDLGDGRAVVVDADGWRVVQNTEVLFRWFPTQAVQVEPQRGGDLDSLLKYINLNTKNPEVARRLLLTFAPAALIPDVARPIVVVHGPQGAAKSTMLRSLKELIDPSAVDLLTYPQNQKELVQIMAHHYFVAFDNLSGLSSAQSDDLCRAVTGQAFSKRALYTDDLDIVYKYRRALGLNGINLVSSKPDLLDRSLIFELEPISNSERKDEKVLQEAFEADKPRILGAMFDALSGAILVRSNVEKLLKQKPRLADYAEWCAAVNIALGGTPDEFSAAWVANAEQQLEEALEHPLAQTIMAVMDGRHKLEMPSHDLFDMLTTRAKELGLASDPEFPKSPRVLVKKMKVLKASLLAMEIEFQYLKTARPRLIVIINGKCPPGSEIVTTSRPRLPQMTEEEEGAMIDLADEIFGIAPYDIQANESE